MDVNTVFSLHHGRHFESIETYQAVDLSRRYNVILIYDLQIWLASCIGGYTVERKQGWPPTIEFHNADDAMLFKLRWI